MELNRKLRAVWVTSAEERSLATNGRGLTEDELCEVMASYGAIWRPNRTAGGQEVPVHIALLGRTAAAGP
jgi:hypothetical protein